MKIYTRKGDRGQTRLGDGTHISKATQRMECMGTLDELSACIGLTFEILEQQAASADAPRLLASLNRIQGHLGELSSQLASASGPRISSRHITWLEHEIDWWSDRLPELRVFILPGGGPAGASLHLARTICRRAERDLVRLAQLEPVAGNSLAYLNRLSDALFVAARYAAKIGGFAERSAPAHKRISVRRPRPG